MGASAIAKAPLVPIHVLNDRVVQRLVEAEKALSVAVGVDQVKLVMDVAAAQEVFAKRQKLGEEIIGFAHAIKTRALAKLGELLKSIPKNQGARGIGKSGVPQENPTLKDYGVDKKTSAIAQQLAALPAETREAIAQREVTMHEVMGDVRRVARMEKLAEISKANTPLMDEDTQPVPILYVDPPWRYEHVETESRAIENQYPTMSLEELCAFPAASAATDDAVLFMWAPSPKLAEAFEVLHSWAFNYRTCMVWVKRQIGMGYYARQQHELLLIATRGNPPTPAPSDRPASVIMADRTEHSKKPDEFYEAIERMYPLLPKRELFQRKPRPGWFGWGNQAA